MRIVSALGRKFWILSAGCAYLWLAGSFSPAQALPSFSKQTGLSCETCHTAFPELTAYGRAFKLNGYVDINGPQIKDPAEAAGDTAPACTAAGSKLELNNTFPLSLMLQAADTWVKNPPAGAASPDSDGNGYLELPCQFSIYYSGKIAPQVGAYVHATYQSVSNSFVFDNSELRFAQKFRAGDKDLVLGLTLNNNPSVQDAYNDTPAWGYPYYTGKKYSSGPSVNTQVESLGQAVGGLGAYAFWDNLLYAEISAYRSAPAGSTPANDIQGFAPYWRVALQRDLGVHFIEIGAFGLDEHAYPQGSAGSAASGGQDEYVDVGMDAQYQYLDGPGAFTLKGHFICETTTWGYSLANPGLPAMPANASDNLGAFRVDATYYYDHTVGATAGYFSTTGSADARLYAADPGNVPDSTGWVFELNYLPWSNTKLTLQYVDFTEFNGDRDASGNNTMMAMATVMY